MDQSFNVSLTEAADLVAMSARIGYSRFGREKQAMGNIGTGALIGGGLGLGAGLLSSLSDEERRKNWLTNSLSSGLIGAGVGGAAGLGLSAYQNLQGAKTPMQQRVQELTDARKAPAPVSDHTTGMLSQLFNSAPSIFGSAPAEGGAGGPPPNPLDAEIFKENPSLKPGNRTLYENAMEYTQRPGDLVASTGLGAVAGHGVDLARKGGFNVNKIQSLNKNQLDAMPGAVGPEITKFQQAMQAAAQAGGNTTGPTSPSLWQRLRGTGGPATGPTISTPQHAPAPGAAGPTGGMQRNTMDRNLWSSWRKPVMQATKTPRSGKAIGAGLGLFAAPALSRMMDPVK